MQLSILSSLKTPILSMGSGGKETTSFEDIVNEGISTTSSVTSGLPYVPPKGTDRTTWFKWYGETYLTSKHWDDTRHRIMKRDEHRCRFCGCSPTKSNGLEVHHRDYDNLWQETDATLLTLCKRCHRGMHRIKRGN